MPGGPTLRPQLLAAAAIVGHFSGGQCLVICLLIHIGEHEYLAGLVILHNAGHHAVRILFQLRPLDLRLEIVHPESGLAEAGLHLHDIGLRIIEQRSTDTACIFALQ